MRKLFAKKAKRLVAILCLIVLVVGLLPLTAFAADPTYKVTIRYSSATAGGLPIVDPVTISGPYPGERLYPIGTAPDLTFPNTVEVEGYFYSRSLRINGGGLLQGGNLNIDTIKDYTDGYTKDIDINFNFYAVTFKVRFLRPDGTFLYAAEVAAPTLTTGY